MLKVHFDKFSYAATAATQGLSVPAPPPLRHAVSSTSAAAPSQLLTARSRFADSGLTLSHAHSYSHSVHPSTSLHSPLHPQSPLVSSQTQSSSSPFPQFQAARSSLLQSQLLQQQQQHVHSQLSGPPGQIKLPPGFLYDIGPPSGPTSPYEMQMQVGLLVLNS